MKSLAALVIALACASLAHAHAHLLGSTPANHSTLAVAPAEITLRFQEEVQLTALALQSGDAKPLKVAALPPGRSRTFSLPLPAIGSGSHTVTWRALSDDGHVMSGTLVFTILPSAVPGAK